MKDVAQLIGDIHPSTVSLALRNSPRISCEVRLKIQKAANQIGYRRDPQLDAFNQHRLKIIPQRASRHIAAISDFSSAEELSASPHHAAARAGALEAAKRLHCKLDFFFCGPGQPSPRRLETMLDARGLRALLLFGVKADSSVMDFAWPRTCTMAIDSWQLHRPLYRVTPDHRAATRQLWHHAWAQGCRHIAMIRSGSALPVNDERAVAGFLLEQLRHSQATPIPIFTLGPERKTGVSFQKWLRTHRPLAILHSSAITKKLSALLKGQNVRCYAYDALSPAEPGIFPDYAEVGRRAIEQLVTLIQTNQLGLPPTAACTYIAVPPPAKPATAPDSFRADGKFTAVR